MSKPAKPTIAQRWVLSAGLMGRVRGGFAKAVVHKNIRTGEVTFAHQTRVVDACRAAGWLDDLGRTTEAGKAHVADVVLP